jgi:hypothetical protein
VETVVEKKMKAKVAVRIITTKRHLRKVDLQRAKENQGTVEGLEILVDAEAKARITRINKSRLLIKEPAFIYTADYFFSSCSLMISFNFISSRS